MITLPLYYILFIYLAFLTFFAILMALNVYHIMVSGSFSFITFIISFFCIVLTILTLFFTFTLLADVEWKAMFTIFNVDWFSGNQSF